MPKLSIALGILLLLSGCAAQAAPPPSPTRPPPPALATSTPGATLEGGILAAMRTYEDVIRDGQTSGIAGLTDSAPVRRFLSSAAAAAPPSEGAAHRRYQVAATSEPIPGLVEADLARDDGMHLLLLFRRHGDAWLITEPTEAELGARTTRAHGRLQIISYAGYTHTDMVVAAIDAAYRQVAQFFGRMPNQELRVVLKPAFGVGVSLPFDVQARADAGSHPQVIVTVPWAVNFRPYAPDTGWAASVQHLVAHELTHFAHQTDPTLLSVNKAPAWVAEGLAEYVSAPLNPDQIRTIQARGGWLSLAEGAGPSLLAIDTLAAKDRTTAYLQAQLIITYLARDDRQRLWSFIDAYAAAPGTGAARLDTALQQSLDTDLTRFTRDWDQWVTARYVTP
jgi:hypothetical protein